MKSSQNHTFSDELKENKTSTETGLILDAKFDLDPCISITYLTVLQVNFKRSTYFSQHLGPGYILHIHIYTSIFLHIQTFIYAIYTEFGSKGDKALQRNTENSVNLFLQKLRL